ncbi:hypothetical protein [Motiliproteus sp. SC1-56]|uniref:hypothetical protein n=1 Tax=Motiliproteus sp. SC1-56 TaxID=2799565 RepID=UPI001A8D878B|nr:hypothetical protein [Motiliproteus sp. SC1-56]
MPKQQNPEKPALPIDLVRKGSAPKLNPQAKGELAYEIGVHVETKHPHVRITSNESGGYFSDEWIPVDTIEKCLAGLPKASSFSSTVLRPVFVEGKSANNAGFLAAVLRKEQVLGPDDSSVFKHLLIGNVAKWKKTLSADQSPKTVKRTAASSSEPAT